MSSVSVQYYKLNGTYIGEVDMDAAIAASHGIPCRFFAGGDIACSQARRAVEGIVTVTTKTELSRNRAVFRDSEELLRDIRESIVRAVRTECAPRPISFPCVMEKSFKRVEDAAAYLERVRARGIEAEYPEDLVLGRDAHTVKTTPTDIDEFYDRQKDPNELRNEIGNPEYKDIIADYRIRLHDELKRCSDPLIGWTADQLLAGRKI